MACCRALPVTVGLMAAAMMLTVTAVAIGGPAFTADPPVLLTSGGQSADLQIVKILLERLRLSDVTTKPLARVEDMRGVKTLVIAVGGSTKGLGAAGIDADQELARVGALLARAQEAGVKVLTMHVGGSARRGELSDRFIAAVVPRSGHVIVASDGNADELFTRLTSQHRVTLESVDRLSDLEPVLRRIFRVR
ncbi:MAG: DUF6305 family protein [bacterium]|nr:DUF6305 family protein [bacterium]